MSGVLGFGREAVRIKVKKCEGSQPPDYRKFSVDPQITSFEVLQSILAKAFDLKTDFAISYSIQDVQGNEVYMPLLSDWELDAAFLKAHNLSLCGNTEPCLSLRVDLKPFEECSDDWEVRNNVPVITQLRTGTAQEAKPSPRFHGIINQMGRTFNMVQRALNFGDDGSASLQPPRPPLSDSEFRRFLDPVGQIMHTKELKSVIYLGGIDPSLRKVVWKHLLNVYPEGMTGKERMDYIKKLAKEYIDLREIWKEALTNGTVNGELGYTTGMVRKDVLRTDRHHPFYAGNDDNQNITSLFNILTTYALNHPKVSYCQGMSDIASPLLVTMGDEAHAYICFCALMTRLCSNFMLDGIAMTQKFTHLAEGLLYYDPEFYNYLKLHQADDLLFCYRWLLLEMKREFAFEDSLRMLEVLWSSLPANPPSKELKLYDVKFQLPSNPSKTPPISPLLKTPRENAYTKVCALRRQSSSISLSSYPAKNVPVPRQIHSLDETLGHMSKSSSVSLATKYTSLDDTSLIQEETKCPESSPSSEGEENARSKLSLSMSNISGISKRPSGHFRHLRERIMAAGKVGMFSSLERLDKDKIIKQQRVVRNFNEFLHFAQLNRKNNQLVANGKLQSSNSAPNSCSTSEDNSPEEVNSIQSNGIDKETVLNEKESNGKSSDKRNFEGIEEREVKRLVDLSLEQLLWNDALNNMTCSEFEDLISKTFKLKVEGCEDFKQQLKQREEILKQIEKVVGKQLMKKDSELVLGNKRLCDNEESKANVVDQSKNAYIDSCAKSQPEDLTSRTRRQKTDTKGARKSDEIFIWENPLPERSPSSIFKHLKLCEHDGKFDRNPTSIFKHLRLSDYDSEIDRSPNSILKSLELSKYECERREISLSPVFKNLKPSDCHGENAPKDPEELTNSCEEITEANNHRPGRLLPPPSEFGGGNPFLMFLCLTVLLQHRDHVMGKGMDYNEMAMHFDKMVRKHNVNKVLNQARQMYAGYLKQHNMALQQLKEHEQGGGDC